MGADVGFIAFRQAPDIDALAAVAGLSGFRLFKHNTRPEWYLEGPSADGEAITFYESLDYTPNGDALKRAKAAARALADACKSAGLKPNGLDQKRLAEALTLNAALGIATLLIYSNDEGVDAGFICERAQVTYAKLPAIRKGVIVFENDAARLDAPHATEFDDEGSPVLDMHQFASEVANAFFATDIRWRVTSDPFEIKASDYTQLAQRGMRAPLRLPGDDVKEALWEIEKSDGTAAQKLRRCIAIIDENVTAMLQERMILAERSERDLLEWRLSACFLHTRPAGAPRSPSYAAIGDFIQEVLTYVRLLRPKPDFRQDLNFAGEAERLRWQWRALKVKLSVASG